MDNNKFSTIGRDNNPGFVLKITCDMDTDSLGGEVLEDRFRIVYIKEGYAIFRNGDSSHLVTSPTILCLNEKDDAEIHNAVNLKMDVMYFDPSCFERYVTFENLEAWKNSLTNDNWFFRPFFIRSELYNGVFFTNYYLGNRVSQLIKSADNELNTQKDVFWPCRSRSYFIELLLLVNSVYDENSNREAICFGKMTDATMELINWLHVHYLEKVTIEMITKQFHTNKTTLNQKFKAIMGMTVMEYISSLRMQIACSFLRKTYLSVNEIVERSGYRDNACFLRTFRKHNGCTPSEYRKQFETSQ
jgi:AraC family L-rhamnose operon regulatory protein RhaS